MAGLNLIPNPGVLVVVGAFFIAAMQIIKVYFLAPFFKLQKKRESMTSGGQEEALKRLEHVKTQQLDLDKRLSQAREEAQAKKNSLIDQTHAQAKSILEKAKKEADSEISAARAGISQTVKSESEKVIQLADRLADELYGTLTR